MLRIAEQYCDKIRAVENCRKFLELLKNAAPGLPELEDARKRLGGAEVIFLQNRSHNAKSL